MRSAKGLGELPAHAQLLADNLVEFHAARLLLLLSVCGSRKGSIEGLTKLAKLDFFVRYPAMFATVAANLSAEAQIQPVSSVESPMIRHHYGPWDPRYYHVLAYLEARGLVQVTKAGARTFAFQLTDLGRERAGALEAAESYHDVVAHMKAVKKTLGHYSGDGLKNLVYATFANEVAALTRGEQIR